MLETCVYKTVHARLSILHPMLRALPSKLWDGRGDVSTFSLAFWALACAAPSVWSSILPHLVYVISSFVREGHDFVKGGPLDSHVGFTRSVSDITLCPAPFQKLKGTDLSPISTLESFRPLILCWTEGVVATNCLVLPQPL